MTTLTSREQHVAQLVAKGLSNKEIARVLQRSEGTVKIHLHNIYEKLAIRNRTVLAIHFQQRTEASGEQAAPLSSNGDGAHLARPFPRPGLSRGMRLRTT
jgi:two-component system nitrate/nitrite response regulator NarL